MARTGLSKRFLHEHARYSRLSTLRPMTLAQYTLRLLSPSERRIITDTPLGIFLYLEPYNNLGASFAAHGAYEENTVDMISSLLRPGDTFLDVGANEGVFSAYASSLVGSKGKVIAIEPQSRMRDIIQINFSINRFSNYEIFEYALSCHDDAVVHLNLYPELNSGASSIVKSYRFSKQTEAVTTKTAEGFFETHHIEHVELVKVDVEGYEPEVVSGFLPLLVRGRIKFLMVDYHKAILERRGFDAGKLHRAVIESGMKSATAKGHDIDGYVLYERPPASLTSVAG